jgi:preprotein translocase subunit SecE
MTDERDDSGEPEDAGASSGAAPRASRFGEGPEGLPARRERAQAARPRGDNPFERAGRFVRDTRAEMRRVSWPTGLEVRNTTIITIIAVIFFAVYLWVVDKGFTLLISQLQKLLGAA